MAAEQVGGSPAGEAAPKYSLPLCVQRGEERGVASGILARYADKLWLITAAHLFVGQQIPHSDWRLWPTKLHYISKNGVIDILMVSSEPEPEPIFAYGKRYDGSLVDIIARALKEEYLEYFDSMIFDLEDRAINVGDCVTAYGYPDTTPGWPGAEQEIKARVLGFDPGFVLTAPPTVPGYSGGPLVSAKGELLGMSVGTRGAYSTCAIRLVIDDAEDRKRRAAETAERGRAG